MESYVYECEWCEDSVRELLSWRGKHDSRVEAPTTTSQAIVTDTHLFSRWILNRQATEKCSFGFLFFWKWKWTLGR
jgi:hypothetical protein